LQKRKKYKSLTQTMATKNKIAIWIKQECIRDCGYWQKEKKIKLQGIFDNEIDNRWVFGSNFFDIDTLCDPTINPKIN
jgi:hypothetical protein